jgi:hypothetical protein
MFYLNKKYILALIASKGGDKEKRRAGFAQKHKIILTHRLFCYYCSIL